MPRFYEIFRQEVGWRDSDCSGDTAELEEIDCPGTFEASAECCVGYAGLVCEGVYADALGFHFRVDEVNFSFGWAALNRLLTSHAMTITSQMAKRKFKPQVISPL